MTNLFEQNLAKLNLTLPPIENPVASYENYSISGNWVFVSGQTPIEGMVRKHAGKLGQDVSVEEAQEAAENCGLQLIAVLKEACGGDLSRVKKIVKITAMVACDPSFEDHPKVVNGCSNLMAAVFGEQGRHARFSIGVCSLPANAPVEIEMIAELA